VIAERHNLTLLDMARPVLVNSGNEGHELAPLGERFAPYAVLDAKDLQNATPALGSMVRQPPYEGFLASNPILRAFRHFGCLVWVHQPGKPFVHHGRFAARAQSGQFMGHERSLESDVFKVLLDGDGITRSQTVVFNDCPRVPAPALWSGPPRRPALLEQLHYHLTMVVQAASSGSL
jgi:hypothetical protein